jgi:hypothetical protein
VTEWNLSVRLTGQGTHLNRTLRDTARDARDASRAVTALRRDVDRLRASTRNNIRIRLDVDAAHLRTDVRAALTTAGAGQGLRVRLDVDAAHLRTDVSAALSSAGSGQGLAVNLRLANSMQLRREVEDAVRWAAWGHRIEIPIGLADPMQLRRDVSAAVRWASMTQTIRVRVEPDTSALTTLGGTLGGSSGSRGGTFGLGSLIPLATAAIPLVAGLTATIGPLTGSLAIAGGAATAFGIALAGQVSALSEASDAEKKYRDAVQEHGQASTQAAEAQLAYQRQLASMPPDTQKAAVALSRLKTTFGDWSDDMSEFTMQPVTKGFTVLEQIIPRLSPQVQSFSGELDRMMNVAGGAINTPGFDRFATQVSELTDQQLDEFTDDVIHLMRVVSEGRAGDGALGELLDYAQQNGPAAREAIQAIGKAVIVLAQGAAEAGPSMLTLVTAAARLVSALPPELIGIILQVAFALKLLQLSGAGMAALAAGIGRVQVQIAALGATSAAAGGGLLGLRAAFLSLGVAARASIIVAAIAAVVVAAEGLSHIGETTAPDVDKLTTSLGNLGRTGKATGYVAEKFGADFGKLNDQIKKVTNPSVVESINNWGESITGGLLDAGDATEEFTKNADSIDESLANLVRNGNAKLAKAALADILKGLDPKEAAKLRGELESYDEGLADLAFEQKMTADSMGIFGQAAADTSAKLSAQKESADGLRASLLALNDVNRSAYDAQIGFEASLDSLTESFKEHGATLDIDTAAGQANGTAMSQAAAAQDEMIATGLAAGDSLETMTGKSNKLRGEMMRLATEAFDGNKKKAREYINTLLGTPESITTLIRAEKDQAVAGLKTVQAAIAATPGAKEITVETLNASAIAALEKVGLKTEQLPDGRTRVFTANGQAITSIDAVWAALNNLNGKTANTYTTHHVTYEYAVASGQINGRTASQMGRADGGIVDFYAAGGIRARKENHIAQIARGGTYRVWAEDETMGEAYVPFAPSKRVRSRAITEQVVSRLGGDPQSIQWNANGSVTDWRYDPATGSLYSPSDAGQAGRKTRKVKGKDVAYFDLGAVEKQIRAASMATNAWNRDLQRVADRVGGDVAEALAGMGKEGVALADKMANGSTKYINDMAASLRNLQSTAKASLTDYTRQITKANSVNKVFADNLAKLAAQGYGDLASQLAAQGDESAQQLAAAAVKDKGKAASANTAAKTANSALTSDQVTDLVQIIAAITTSKTGIHDVAARTQIGEDVIIAIANKARTQISSSLGSRASRFLADLGKANAHQAYADGGIRAGLYATRGGMVSFAEPSTGGEAYLPLGANKRRTALPVLADVAHRFGLGLTDAQAGRPVIVVRNGDNITIPVTPVRTGASASDIGFQVGRSVRRARRGGVNARAGG